MEQPGVHTDRPQAGTGHSGRFSRTLLAYRTLVDLGVAGVRYCIWKSIDRFEAGARGETDHDILLDHRHWDRARALLERQGWIGLDAEAWRFFPDVFDYIRYDPVVDRFIHFHIHLRLVMGESLTKNLNPPLEKLYLATASSIGGLPVAAPELEFSLFMVRVALKINWRDYARILWRRSFRAFYRAHADEYAHLKNRCERRKLAQLLERVEMAWLDSAPILSAYDDLCRWGVLHRRRLVRCARAHRRYGHLARRLEHSRRLWRQWQDGVGKTLRGGGRAFAFCGSEGSGKTALIGAVQARLEPHIRMTRLYMGGSQHSRGPLRRLVHACAWPPYLVARKLLKISALASWAEALAERYRALEWTLIGREQLRRHRRGCRDVKNGRLVLYERFPLFPGPGDQGPKGGRNFEPGQQASLIRHLSRPDLIFLLSVETDAAARRKADHDPAQLERGVREFDAFRRAHEKDPRIVMLDGAAPLPDLVSTVMERIGRELQENH
ncbi:MAG: hypothetical protein O7F16_05895 [Acidobacteria bacterium]|nr:hypothetical protein [Acidobacteriota bacterium]